MRLRVYDEAGGNKKLTPGSLAREIGRSGLDLGLSGLVDRGSGGEGSNGQGGGNQEGGDELDHFEICVLRVGGGEKKREKVEENEE